MARVVVIHDALGMTADLRGQCDWLAGSGFRTVGPDLYSWGRKLSCIHTTFSDLTSRRGRAFDDIDAVRGWLADRRPTAPEASVSSATAWAAPSPLLLAVGHDFSASSVNYGGVPNDAADYLAGACPIVGSFGEDRMLEGAAPSSHRPSPTSTSPTTSRSTRSSGIRS